MKQVNGFFEKLNAKMENLSESGQRNLGCLILILICGACYAIPLTRGAMVSAFEWTKATVFPDRPWLGLYYENAGSGFAEDKTFDALTDCREWANSMAASDGQEAGEWDYSCGYQCSYSDDPLRRAAPGVNYDCERVTK